MAQIIAILTLINQLLPLIRQSVAALEDLFPQAGTGAAKKALLNGILDSAVAGSATLQTTLAAAAPAISLVIDAVAALHKSTVVPAQPV